MRKCLPLLALLATLAVAGPARAATFTVTRFDDPVGGVCNSGVNCSLRQAVSAANATAAADTIALAAGTYNLTITSSNEDANANGDLDILNPVTIAGAGAGATTVNASGVTDRVFQVTDPASGAFAPGLVTFSNLTMTGGHGASGGGLYVSTNVPSVQILGSAISGNVAANGYGGGINATTSMPLQIVNSTIAGNSGTSFGGGIMVDGSGQVTITGTTISGNSGGDGGGIWTAAPATITNTTISGNSTNTIGGGYVNENGTTTFTNVTIAFNKLVSGATFGGIEDFSSTINFKNTIVSNNDGTECDSAGNAGFFVSQGNNVDDGNSCAFTQASDRQNTNPLLGSLADNGGPTQTHALPKGSPAVDAGDNAACPATDQRGEARPFDGNDDGSAVCDAGAFELRGPPPTAVTGAASAVTSSDATVSGTVDPSGFLTDYHFEYGTTTAYGDSTPATSAGAGAADEPVSATISGLAPGTLYHFRLVDSGPGGTATGADAVFSTEAIGVPGVPPPTEGVTANLSPVSGDVFMALPLAGKARADVGAAAVGSINGFGPLVKVTGPVQIPIGALVNTKHGVVAMTSATDAFGGTQSGQFSKGTFIVRQARTQSLTTAVMAGGNLDACSKLPHGGAAKQVAAARSRRHRSLFANVHGRFRTRGRNSAATVRGTEFLVKDTCAGTTTSVRRGTVTVRDYRLRKNVRVKAPHKYFARAPKRGHKRR